MLTPLRNWHNKRIRKMCRVTMHQVELYGITSVELQKRIGIWDLDYYVGRRTLQWVGHVVRMDKSRLPRRLLTAWVREPRPDFGQEMSYGRSLERWLKLFDLPLRFTERRVSTCRGIQNLMRKVFTVCSKAVQMDVGISSMAFHTHQVEITAKILGIEPRKGQPKSAQEI